jgi:hypothetical protein
MIFESSMGPKESRCDVRSGTTQGHIAQLGMFGNFQDFYLGILNFFLISM